ncbi:MAG TPA: hypothetical protein VHL53_11535, partial [Acidimicrobiia bacterium]|nr:hypothetical protein [Acidimicrobiia bacterium]
VDSDNDEETPPAGLTLAGAAQRRRSYGPRVLVGAAVTVAVLVAAAVVHSAGGGPPSTDATRPGIAAPAGGALAEPKALPAQSFDPYGDDKAENQATVGNVADGDPATVWKTSSYNDNFPKLKPGVGVYLDLGRSQTVRTVKVSATAGYAAQIYVADRPSTDLAGWGRPVAAGSGTFDTRNAQGRYVLVWFTSLPQVDGGYKVEVSEINVDYS